VDYLAELPKLQPIKIETFKELLSVETIRKFALAKVFYWELRFGFCLMKFLISQQPLIQ
jgi:hypothetical protein